MPARLPDNEATRLAALRVLEVLDSGPEAALDALVRVAPIVCGTPISLTSLVDAERQWFNTNIGLPEPTRRSETSRNAQRRPETPTRVDFRAHAILDEQIFEVSDAALYRRFADRPLLAHGPGIGFYAGAPVQLSDGSRVGIRCVSVSTPHRLSRPRAADPEAGGRGMTGAGACVDPTGV